MDMSAIGDVWHEVVGTQPHPPWWLVTASGIAAVAAVSVRSVWHVLRNIVTIAHEGGHAVAALVTGRQLQGIRLHSDTSGVTVSSGKPYGPGMILTAFAGYVTPSLLGLGAAALLATDHITALLWVSIALLAAILVMIRNVYGVLSVVTTGAVIFAVSWFASTTVQAAFAYAFTWFLLLAGGGGGGGGAAPGAAPPTRTPTSWPASPVCPDSCGCSASAWSPSSHCWPGEPGCCHPRCHSFRTGSYFFSSFSPLPASTTYQAPPNEVRPWPFMSPDFMSLA
jgi:hypothetical protein